MANNYFKFKQFTIIQQKSAMKVGTDGVLLGAWANCAKTNRILDIGTGTGLIALMLAQRSNAFIDAVEIEANAASEAFLNIQNSPWANRIEIFNISIQDFARSQNHYYDLIVCNPPFFMHSQKAQDNARTFARHNDSLSIADLFLSVNVLLAPKGNFSIVIPTDILTAYKEEADKLQFYITNKLWIWPTPEINPKRVLVSFERNQKDCIEDNLILEISGRHNYSEEYKNLTRDFYLAF